MPAKRSMKDTLGLSVISSYVTADSTISVQIQDLTNAQINNKDPYFSVALSQCGNDALRAMAKIMVTATEGEVLAAKDLLVTISGVVVKGLEVKIKYKNGQNTNSSLVTLNYTRIFHFKNRFVAFSIAGINTNDDILTSHKTYFFNSIAFK